MADELKCLMRIPNQNCDRTLRSFPFINSVENFGVLCHQGVNDRTGDLIAGQRFTQISAPDHGHCTRVRVGKKSPVCGFNDFEESLQVKPYRAANLYS